MNLKQLEYFVQVAELGSFSRAAQVLDIAQPALSRQVRALEIELHETLLLRNGRGVALTEPGRRLFEHGVAILQHVAQAREDMGASRDEPVGRITIGLPPSLGRQLTLPLIDRFRSGLPRARLAVVEGLTAHLAEWITSGRVDLALLHNPDPHPALAITPVLQEHLCLVSPRPAQPAGAAPLDAEPLPFRELAGYSLVVPERQHVIGALLETQATLAGLRLDIAWEVSSVPAIIDLVCAGYGHAVLTSSAVGASGRTPELLARPLVEPSLTSVICLARSANKRPTALLRQAMQILTELVTALPQHPPPATSAPLRRGDMPARDSS
jgi:LysR family nitrogen assimilation transcriptional regulator